MAKEGRKILIIDDDPFILTMYLLKFKEEHFTVETAHNGKDGLLKLKEFRPEIILLDVVMPGIDGFDVLKQMRQEPIKPPPKIIFLTNFGQKEDIERGMKLGADDYIIKAHFTPTEVVEKVKKILTK